MLVFVVVLTVLVLLGQGHRFTHGRFSCGDTILSDSEVVYRATGRPGQILHDKRVTDAIFYSCSRVRRH